MLPLFALVTSVAFAPLLAAAAVSANCATSTATCKCYPGDACWPTKSQWASLNSTVGGRLVATVPLGSPCHHDGFSPYDPAACAAVVNAWPIPSTHYLSSSSPMADWFANNSCNPFTPASAPCIIGTQVQYAVNATSLSDYQATLNFASKHNIRLVIRNTGHDYLGKSGGAGALALWTHFLKEQTPIKSYNSSYYVGPAMKFGAGVQIFEAYKSADAAGLAVAGGDCDTIGLTGGFTQGAGLGPLTGTVGLGSDQVLEWEVVTAAGKIVTATPNNNYSDLYWALCGGGGGAYAAVFSMTVRAYHTMPVAAASLAFALNAPDSTGPNNALRAFLGGVPALAAAGSWSTFYLIDGYFELLPAFAPNLSVAQLQALLQPTLDALEQNNVPYAYSINSYSTFKQAYDATIPPQNVTNANIGGRLVPQSSLADTDSINALMGAFQSILDGGAAINGIVTNQTNFPHGVQNSVNPAFRNALIDIVIALPFNETDYSANIPLQKEITQNLIPTLTAVTPNSGSYLNEGDINTPNWQEAFYGSNYNKLATIKAKYDPNSLFYGLTAVGSDKWEYRQSTDGRLCPI